MVSVQCVREMGQAITSGVNVDAVGSQKYLDKLMEAYVYCMDALCLNGSKLQFAASKVYFADSKLQVVYPYVS